MFLFLLFLHYHSLCCVCSGWGKRICFYSFCFSTVIHAAVFAAGGVRGYIFIPSVSPLSSTLLCLQQVGQGNMFLFLLFLQCHSLCCVCSGWGKRICFYSFFFSTVIHCAVFAAVGARGYVFIPSFSPLSFTLLCLQQVGKGDLIYSFCFSTVITVLCLQQVGQGDLIYYTPV